MRVLFMYNSPVIVNKIAPTNISPHPVAFLTEPILFVML